MLTYPLSLMQFSEPVIYKEDIHTPIGHVAAYPCAMKKIMVARRQMSDITQPI